MTPIREHPLRLAFSSLLAVVHLAATGPGPAPSSAGLESYLRAKAVLDAGVEAIGGAEALKGIGTVRRQMAGDWFGSGQSRRPYIVPGPTLEPPPTTQHTKTVSTIDYEGPRWLDESVEFDDAGDAVTRILAVTAEQGFETITYRDEKPFFRAFSRDDLTGMLSRRLRRHPEGLLRLALDRPETLEWVGVGEALGRKQRVISLADPSGALVLLYFDEKTHLLTKSETLRPHALAGDAFAEILYDDYRLVGGLRLPFHYVDRVAGIPTEEMRASAIDLQAPIPEGRLRPPGDTALMAEDPARPAVQDLGAGLYMIRGVYNTAFAVFRDHVIVFEAPLSSRYAEDCLALIRATAPGKPIRYVVSTHFHTDHIAGVRPYVAQDVPIVTTPDAGAAIRRVASARHTMHPDVLSTSPRSPRIETVARERVFDDGTNRAELHEIGPTDHVAQLLVAYFPNQRVLFVADVWDVISSQQHIAGADAATMAGRIEALGLGVDRIIPVHGVPATMQDLKRGLAVRAKYFK